MQQAEVEEFLASFAYTAATKRTYACVLAELAQLADLEHLSAAGLLGFVERESWGNSRQCVALAASQKFLRWRYGAQHPALAAKKKRERGKMQRWLDVERALDVLSMFDTYTPKGARDRAIAALLMDTGLRASELCRLETDCVNLERRTLQVLAKRSQWRSAIFSEETAQYIREWQAHRAGKGDGRYLFISLTTKEKLTPEGLNSIIREWGRRLGIRLSPHDFRRTLATLATIFGGPSRTVQVAGGWSDVAMVERYTRGLTLSAMEPYLPVANLIRRGNI